MANFKHTEIKGVIPALITPFDENENFDEVRMRKIVNWLIDEKVDGFYLIGSTGEGFLMTPEERKKVVEVVVDEVNGRVPVIVHVGAISTKISIDLSKHAESVGADAISSVPPFYWRFDENHIFKYYEDIASSVSIPMIIYNVPLTGLLGFDFIVRLSTIPNVKGVKYTAYTHQNIYKIKDACGDDFLVFSGADEMAVSGLFNGADGIVGSFYSMLPDLFVRLYDNIKNDKFDEAQHLQQCAVAIIDASLKYDYYSVIKEGMKLIGIDAGYVRAPFINVTPEQMESVKKEFRSIREKYKSDDILVLKSVG